MEYLYAISFDFIDRCQKTVDMDEFVRISERRFQNQIKSVVDEALSAGVRLIRLAGPSGSGKTTTTKRIVEAFKDRGIPAYYLSMDNWYKTLSVENMPKNEDGDPDFESPDLLDLVDFKRDVRDLLAGKEVRLKEFDFINRVSRESSRILQCEANGIVVIEGIHAINPMFDTEIEDMKVYVEPSPVRVDNDTVISSSNIRLCRRLHRDLVDRGMSLEDTMKKCRSVDIGQRKYIDPYTRDPDILRVDTLIYYELFIHKNEVLNMECLNPIRNTNITKDIIPANSILREFYK